MNHLRLITILFFSVCISNLNAQISAGIKLDTTYTRVQSSLSPNLKKLGTLKAKNFEKQNFATWSLGCETLDRDHANWDNYRDYILPLGIKHVRLQGGWGRTEKEKGVYNFDWLDKLVDDALSLGLEVCLETSYGNRLYEEKAALGPGGTLPAGEETLKAWDAWVKEMVKRYSKKGVHDWMMYNEPNLNKANKVEDMAIFNIRTAEIIKKIDKDARIGGLVLSDANPELIEEYLKILKENGKEDLFYWLIYHAYGTNPDKVYPEVVKIQELIDQYAPHLKLWQGEAGCASEEVQFALSGVDWTELSHAKWNARRMLGDMGHGVKSAVFTISDLSYHKNFISRYGLLKTNPDNSIVKVKTAYYVVQNIVSLFDDQLELMKSSNIDLISDKSITAYLFTDQQNASPIFVFWNGTKVPSNLNETDEVSFSIKNVSFENPVWLDLITGNIYEIPDDKIKKLNSEILFIDIPVYDSPVVIAEKDALSFTKVRVKK